MTRYLPADWLDEFTPEPHDRPDDFIAHNDADGWHLNADDELSFSIIKLTPGQIVAFTKHENYGGFTATVVGGIATPHSEIPACANHFCADNQPDNIAETLQDMVAELERESLDEPDAPPYEISFDAYWWSSEAYLFEFVVSDGRGMFIERGVSQ